MAMEKRKYPRVVVFTTPTCTYCRAAKKYFREQGVPFKDVDVSRDSSAARDMVRRSGQQGVPVIDIGGKIIVGFDRPKIDRLLGLH
jgi:glutaredoxin 3